MPTCDLFAVANLLVIRDVVAEMCGKPATGTCQSELIVMTGRGRHSHNGVARLRPAVIAFLTTNNYQYVSLYCHSLISPVRAPGL